MKPIILVASLLLAAPASASTILPNLYASTYCSLRSIGVSSQEATTVAIRDASVSGDDWTYITVAGRKVQSDVAMAVMAVMRLCPEALK